MKRKSMLALAGAVWASVAMTQVATEAPVVVHEWGTFTSVAGEDGRLVPWRALVQPWELPEFVYRDDTGALPAATVPAARLKAALRGLVRLETPVAYFYASHPTRVSFRVDFPNGRLTEWYPAAAARPARLTWHDIEVLPGDEVSLPTDGSDSHYYFARTTSAAPLRVETEAGPEVESFLFYRGVGQWEPPLLARLQGEHLELTALGVSLGRALVFEARDGRTAWRAVDLVQGSTRVSRPRAGSDEGARVALSSLLVEGGLFAEEAEAMLETWDGSWFEDGLRVLFVMPPALVDEMLPLRLHPVPLEVRRVFVGRLEVLTPERTVRAEDTLASLPLDTPADEALLALGRFADPLLRRILERTQDPTLRQRIADCLAVP